MRSAVESCALLLLLPALLLAGVCRASAAEPGSTIPKGAASARPDALGAKAPAASDFNFTVPIALNNLHPDLDRGRVHCGVSKARIGGPMWTPANYVGEGLSGEFAIRDGSYSGDVIVSFDAYEHQRPGDAVSYHCKPELHCTRDGNWHNTGWLRTAYRGIYSLSREPGANAAWTEGMLP